jgi:predicted dehydrogenase
MAKDSSTQTVAHRGPFRVGLLGAGYIVEFHAKALRALRETHMVAVCDRSLGRARACAENYGIPAVYESVGAMLRSEQLDAVHVLLPPEVHAHAALEVLEGGVAVLLEKPMAVSSEECGQILALARERKVRLGVGHNFLFARVYDSLREDLSAGVFGPLDHVTITWNKELGQIGSGPFDLWMLRDPKNVMLEIGPHPMGCLLDLLGKPSDLRVTASNQVDLPNDAHCYRRWQIHAYVGKTAVDVNISLVRGYSEHQIHVRGALASATADFERDTYVIHHHRPAEVDFDRYTTLHGEAWSLVTQASRTLGNYAFSKVRRSVPGNPYAESILRAIGAFYSDFDHPVDRRLSGEFGSEVVDLCAHIGRLGVASTSMPTSRHPRLPLGTASAQTRYGLHWSGAGSTSGWDGPSGSHSRAR